MNMISPNCFQRKCLHFLGIYQPEEEEGSQVLKCTAFLKGIPGEIAFGDEKHLVKYPGQKNDIVYEKFIEPEE